MGNLKTFSKLSALGFFVVVILGDVSAVNTPLASNSTTSNNSSCFLKVIPLHYEINIGPIKNSSGPVRVSCWVKIRAEIGRNDCESNSGTLISLDSRNCHLDLKTANISKENTLEKTHLLPFQSYPVKNHVKNQSFVGVPSQYILQFNKNQLKSGDQISFFIPYEVELKRDYPKGTYQGLFYYDPRQNNSTDFLFYFPLHARYIFPVFKNSDQFLRPTFKISVARSSHDGFVSVSNTDIVETVENPESGHGWVTDHFRESSPMKMDQITLFVLGGYQNYTIYKENLNNNSETRATSLWVKKNHEYKNETIFHTLSEVQRIMDYFNDMFNEMEYPLNKIDFVTVPWNTASMSWQKSNLGIVLSSMSGILKYEKGLRESKDNVDLYDFIASQIALQWFRGITSSNDEYKNVALSGETLAVYVINWVLKHTNQPIPPFLNGNYETEIPSLLNMMESIFSREAFQYAICQIYLPKLISNRTFPNNLWMSIQQSLEYHNRTDILPSYGNSTVSVAEIFASWIDNLNRQPIIRINAVKNTTDSIELYQEYTGLTDVTVQKGWWVPVNISTENGHVLIWISPNNTENSSKLYQNSDIIDTDNRSIFVNPELTKYYDVHYSEKLMKNIITQLEKNHTIFPENGRKDLITKQFTLASNDNKWETLEMALEMTKYLGKEMDKKVWGNVLWGMGRFNGKFVQHPSRLEVYLGEKINQVLEKIGIFPNPEDDENIAELRLLLIEFSYIYEVPLVIEYGSELMAKWMENITINPFLEEIAPEVRQSFYCAALEHSADDTVFNFIYDQIVSQDNRNETKRICKALTCTQNDELLKSLMKNDSKLASSNNTALQTCYLQYIPFEILWRKPLTMKQNVYDFWMKYNLEENEINANQTDQINMLIPWSYEPLEFSLLGFLDSIKYLNLKDNVRFFTDDSIEKRESSLMTITWIPNEIGKEFDEILNKSENWFAMQFW